MKAAGWIRIARLRRLRENPFGKPRLHPFHRCSLDEQAYAPAHFYTQIHLTGAPHGCSAFLPFLRMASVGAPFQEVTEVAGILQKPQV